MCRNLPDGSLFGVQQTGDRAMRCISRVALFVARLQSIIQLARRLLLTGLPRGRVDDVFALCQRQLIIAFGRGLTREFDSVRSPQARISPSRGGGTVGWREDQNSSSHSS